MNYQQQLMSSSAYTSSGQCYRIAQNEESGRSMVEMMGVLAVVGVISVGGLAGYNTAMTKHRSNELINEAQKRAYTVSAQLLLGNAPNLSEFNDNRWGVTQKGLVDGFAVTVSGVDRSVCRNIVNTMGDGKGMMRRVAKNELNYPTLSAGQCGDSNSMAFLFNNDMSDTEDGMEIQEMKPYTCASTSGLVYQNGNEVGGCGNGCKADSGDYHLAADALENLCSGDTRLVYKRGRDCLVRTVDGREVGICREFGCDTSSFSYPSDLYALESLCHDGYSSDYTYYSCGQCEFGCNSNYSSGGYSQTESNGYLRICDAKIFTCTEGRYVWYSSAPIARCDWCHGTEYYAYSQEEALNALCGGNYSSMLPTYFCKSGTVYELTGSGNFSCPYGCNSGGEIFSSGGMSDLCATQDYWCDTGLYIRKNNESSNDRPSFVCNSGCRSSDYTYAYSDSAAAGRLCNNGNYTDSFSWNQYFTDGYRIYYSSNVAAYCLENTGNGEGYFYANDVYGAAQNVCVGGRYTTNVQWYTCSYVCYNANCYGSNYYPSSNFDPYYIMCY